MLGLVAGPHPAIAAVGSCAGNEAGRRCGTAVDRAPADRLPPCVIAPVTKPSVLQAACRPISSTSQRDRAGAAVQPMPAGIEGGKNESFYFDGGRAGCSSG